MSRKSRSHGPQSVSLDKKAINRLLEKIVKDIANVKTSKSIMDVLNNSQEHKMYFQVDEPMDESFFLACVKEHKHLNCLEFLFSAESHAPAQQCLELRLTRESLAEHIRLFPKRAPRATIPEDIKDFIDPTTEPQRLVYYQKKTPPTSRRQQVSKRPASLHGTDATEFTLASVVAAYVGLSTSEADEIRNLIEAFGGKVLSANELQNATHIIVSPNRADLEARQTHGKPRIVLKTWLEEVIQKNADPMDDVLIRKHSPWGPDSSTKRPRFEPVLPTAADQQHGPMTSSSSSAAAVNPQRHMSASLSETYSYLLRERPAELEAGQLRVAIERSLMDVALEMHRGAPEVSNTVVPADEPSPAALLGLTDSAGPAEIRRAYRTMALAAHPDKGGDATAFCRLQRAYLALMAGTRGDGTSNAGEYVECLALPAPSGGGSKDFQLRNHRELVKQKFKEDGIDLQKILDRMALTLKDLHLSAQDVGASNRNEKGEMMFNQCFYLSLARSYCEVECMTAVRDTALGLKRVIEAAVLADNPDWAEARVGEHVQAFSDFLVFVLGTNALLSELAVAVFDAASGGVEIYMGRCFPGRSREVEQRSNLLTILYQPGHYQALVSKSSLRPSFRELRECLEKNHVQHVITYL